MPFLSTSHYNYDPQTVARIVPSQSGVYGIFNRQWQYVGETNDLRRRLLEHLNETGTPLSRSASTGFTFELCPAQSRVQRQNILIAELGPVCNQMFG